MARTFTDIECLIEDMKSASARSSQPRHHHTEPAARQLDIENRRGRFIKILIRPAY